MQLIRILLYFLLLDAFGSIAFARIGEPVAQLTIRYGTGTNAGKDVLMFHKQNWTITVWLIDGLSAQESFQKSGGVTDDDVRTLLSLNADGQAWKEKPVDRTIVSYLMPTLQAQIKAWVRNDGAYAYIAGGARNLVIESKQKVDADEAHDDATKKAQQSSLRGF